MALWGHLAYPGFLQFVYYFNTQILSLCLNELLLNHATNINDKISSCKPHISNTRVFGVFFLQPQPRSVYHYAPLSPSKSNTHAQHISNDRAPFKTTSDTHTHHISSTRVFRFFYNNSREADHPSSLPNTHTHTHKHTLSRRVRIDTLRKGERKRICDIFEMVLLGYEVCRYHLLGMDVGAGRSSSNKP